MKSSETDLVLAHILEVAIPIICESFPHFPAKSCIPSTRIIIEVLRHFRISARPLPVRVTAFNPVAQRFIRDGRVVDLESVSRRHRGAYVIGIGSPNFKPAAGDWPGHLVVYVEDRYLLDLSIGQLSRPERHLWVSPLCVDIGSHFDLPGQVRGVKDKRSRAYLQYEYAPGLEGTWETSPLWTNAERLLDPTRRIVEGISRWLRDEGRRGLCT
jgi:hypothetical protein